MPPNGPFVVVLPVRGLRVSASEFEIPQLLEQSWTLVGQDAFVELGKAAGRNDSVRGNIEMIVRRLNPSALLLVRYYPDERKTVWDEQKAETILACLNLTLLLIDLRNDDMPAAVYRARYNEYCDLPLAFDQSGVRSVGHTSRMGLLAPDAEVTLSPAELQEIVDSAPAVLRSYLNRARTRNSREAVLVEGAANILGAFDTLSPGAFTAHLIAMCQSLLDSQEGAAGWDGLKRRLRVICRGHDVSGLLEIRHRYSHGAKQPSNDGPAFRALALAVHVWAVVEQLYRQIPNRKDVEHWLDLADTVHQLATEEKRTELSSVLAVPEGPAEHIKWIGRWMGEMFA